VLAEAGIDAVPTGAPRRSPARPGTEEP